MKDYGKSPNIWKLNNLLLNNPQVKIGITRIIRKHFELCEIGNTKHVTKFWQIKSSNLKNS